MGGGRWSNDTYSSTRNLRASRGVDDFEYSRNATKATAVHANLNPIRIKDKPFHALESRDSLEHPNSNAVFVSIDVTGSNIDRAREAQKKLPNLMDLLHRYLDDPQVLVAANDDIHVDDRPAQISDFESDNRIDEHIRNLILTGDGGGNGGESYDLIMWAAANRTVLDCFAVRNRKGYFFMYADEPIFKTTSPTHIHQVFGETIPTSIPIEETIEQLKVQYHVFVLWPMGGYIEARDQFVELFGRDSVVTLQHPALICETIGSLIGVTEGRVDEDGVVNDLVAVGTSQADAQAISGIVSGRRIRVDRNATA